jgi:hypothetical protein
LCCLIQEQCELGIEPMFWPKLQISLGTCCNRVADS